MKAAPLQNELALSLAVMLCALLRKHKIIDAASVDDPEGYDNYQTVGNIKEVANDLAKLLSE